MDQTPTGDRSPVNPRAAASRADEAIYEPIATEIVEAALAQAETAEGDAPAGAVQLVDPEADIYEATAIKLIDGMREPDGRAPAEASAEETEA